MVLDSLELLTLELEILDPLGYIGQPISYPWRLRNSTQSMDQGPSKLILRLARRRDLKELTINKSYVNLRLTVELKNWWQVLKLEMSHRTLT